MEVASSSRRTLACVGCGSWSASWASRFAGDFVEHNGDLSQWCPDCAVVYDVLISELVDPKVRIAPGDEGWYDRSEWWHVSGDWWWDECPPSAYVHVGPRAVCQWLDLIRVGTSDSVDDPVLHKVRVRDGAMPKRLIMDKGDIWGGRRVGYVQLFEQPGSVCLYLPKRDLELVERIKM